MNRIELIESLAEEHQLSKAAAGRILGSIVENIVTAVAKGDSVSILGFGTFKSHKRAARTGFNPREGKKIKIAAKKVPKFLPGTAFKERVAAGRVKKAK